MSETQTQTACILELEGDEGIALSVDAFEIIEALCFLTEIRLQFRSRQPLCPRMLLGKKLILSVARAHAGSGGQDLERVLHGVVFSAEASVETDDTPSDDAHSHGLSLLARPRFARLMLGRDHRVFQDLSVPEVLEAVVQGAGLPSDCFELALQHEYAPRACLTQFAESDQHFLERILGEEGIAYLVKQDVDGEKLVFFDHAQALEHSDYAQPLTFGDEGSGDGIDSLRELRRMASDTATLRDYDLRRPSADLTPQREAERAEGREVYRHPGLFSDATRGQRLAQVWLERLQLPTHVFRGEGTAFQLQAGRIFEVGHHHRSALEGEMIVLSATHTYNWPRETESRAVEQAIPGLRTRFEAVPQGTPLRPPEPSQRPIIGGTHVAFVTGAGSEQLHGNEMGQVKVRFPWDRSGILDDRSSSWLRVGQLPLPGSMIVPRVGFEVLVDYELGDLDRPLVVGHLYNGQAPVPYALPGAATRSSVQTATVGGAGANELRFEDAAGGEQIFLNASYDYTCSVENDSRAGVMANETSSIGGQHSLSVAGSYSATVSASRQLSVGGNRTAQVAADHSQNTGGDLKVMTGSYNEVCKGDWTQNIAGSYDLNVGAMMTLTGIAGINRSIVGSSSTSIGAVLAETTLASRAVTIGGSFTETVGALKMIKATTVAVSCGAAYAQNCASETLTIGGNRMDTGALIAIAAASLKVEAANINISGEDKVVMRIGGTTIEVLPSSVKIKSTSIDLRGVKKLQSLSSHETT